MLQGQSTTQRNQSSGPSYNLQERSHRQTRELQTNSITELKLQDTSQTDLSQAL